MKTTNILLYIIASILFIQTGMQLSAFFLDKKSTDVYQASPSTQKGIAPINSIPDFPPTAINFNTTSHDFGVINDDKRQYVKFHFTNTGKEPLLILGAEGSCGCTVPTWPKEPILPNESGDIEVAFDPNGKSGEQSKIVTITANTEPTTTILTIKATIIKSN